MKRVKRFLSALRGKLFHRDELYHTGGIPYVLGRGLSSPCIEPGLTVHWHPPFSVMPAEEPAARKSGIGHLFEKLGFRKKSA